MKTAEDYSELINNCKYTRLYICDGEGCSTNRDNCFKNNGGCVHTANESHSIKQKLADKFPPTRFVERSNNSLFEEIDLSKFLNYFL